MNLEKELIARNMILISEIKSLFENFNMRGIKPVLLKGITSKDFTLKKHIKDIDLYSAEFYKAVRILKELGYEPSYGNPFVFFNYERQYPVDLHRDIWCLKKFEVEEFYLDGVKIFRLKEPYLTIYDALNKISKSEFEKVKNIDLNLLPFAARIILKNKIKLNPHMARILLSNKPLTLLAQKLLPDDYFLKFRGENMLDRVLRIALEAKTAITSCVFK